MKIIHINNRALKKKEKWLQTCLFVCVLLLAGGCTKKEEPNASDSEVVSESETASDTAAPEESTEGTAEPGAAEQKDASCYATFTVSNQWDAGDGNIGAQCDIVLYNNTAADINDWKLEIPVTEGLKVDSLWNGKYEIKDNKLIITPMDYNKQVFADSSMQIGFIMFGASAPEESGLLLTVDGSVVANNPPGAGEPEDGKEQETTQTATENEVAKKPPKGDTPLGTYGKLSVKGTNLVDKDGNTVQLTGISTHGLSWFPDYVNKSAFQSLRDQWGVDIIRLAMYPDESMGYCTGGDKEKLKALIDQAVKDTYELGMYVVIDWHVLGDATPKKHQEEAERFFEEMSSLYAGYENVIYEICNEPNSGTSWEDVKSYAESVIQIIRKNHKDAVIIVGTPTWCQDVDVVAKNPITKYDNLLYAVHFYAATHKEDLRKRTESAIDAGLPLIISEFSICDASGGGDIDYDSAAAWMKLADKYHLSFIAWSLCNKAETASLLSPDCTKTSDFKEEDLSETGKWLMKEISKR